MKKVVVVQSAIIAVLLLLSGVLVIAQANGISLSSILNDSNVSYIEFGDEFSGFDLWDHEGKAVTKISKGKKYTVTFYLSSSCSSCLDSISDFERFAATFGDQIDYAIIWQDKIPDHYINKYSLDPSINYSLNGEAKLSTATPTFFIPDDSGFVIFKDVSRENLIEKLILLDVTDSDELKSNANKYIVDNYSNSSSNKPVLIYFYMPGCSDCDAASKLFESNNVSDDYEIIYIYKYDSENGDYNIDKDKLFGLVYDINWYPSFIMIDKGSYREIGETPVENLLSVIYQR